MLLAKAVAWACVLAMASVLIFAFVSGDFLVEGRELLSMPWGIVSLVDLYAGFALFSAWIVFRERALPRSAVWVILTLVLGFFSNLFSGQGLVAQPYYQLHLFFCRDKVDVRHHRGWQLK